MVVTGSSPESMPSVDEYVSQHLLCPISHCLMEQPVVAPSGHTYDLDMITAWLCRRGMDPLSGAPLSADVLYPNRAIFNEIVDQLEQLAERAAAKGDDALAEAAREKIETVKQASARQRQRGQDEKTGRLERWIDRCASGATWWGEFAREQALVFTTSLGAIACLAIDVKASYQFRRNREGQPQPLLATFIHLAVYPLLPPPRHWATTWRVTLQTLRCVLLLPLLPASLGLLLGGVFSLVKFGKRFAEVRAVEFERAAAHQWWVRARDLGSGVTGVASFLLFLRIWMDSRGDVGRRR